MPQQRFQIKGKAGCLKEAFYPPPLILPYVSSVCPAFLCFKYFFVMLKMHIFYLKMQTRIISGVERTLR